MLFDKRRAYSCALFETLSDSVNPFKWYNKELYYPVAFLTGIDLVDLKKDTIVTIEMDGMSGAERDLMLRCKVLDPKLVLCKPGVALSIVTPDSETITSKAASRCKRKSESKITEPKPKKIKASERYKIVV